MEKMIVRLIDDFIRGLFNPFTLEGVMSWLGIIFFIILFLGIFSGDEDDNSNNDGESFPTKNLRNITTGPISVALRTTLHH